MISIKSASPNDYSHNRRINGLIRLKEIKLACTDKWKELRNRLFRKIKQKIAKKLKN